MSTRPPRTTPQPGGASESGIDSAARSAPSRREFLAAGAAGLAGASLAPPQIAGLRSAAPADLQGLIGDARRRRILLRGGVVLSLDPAVGDFEKADVLIDGKTIAQIAPNISVNDAEVIDCTGAIVMPGFITTHQHQYMTLQRSIIPDGFLQGAWPLESYGPYDPEDCYIAELVTCLSQITEGVTMGTDTSQASHTPEHTDAMIRGLMDSGRRMVYNYGAGTNRTADGFPYEFPGTMGDTTKGIGRIAKTYFSSKDQLVTLGFNGGPVEAFAGAPYTGWQLARSFSAVINNHNNGNGNAIVAAAADARNGTDWSDVTSVHCVRWQDSPTSSKSRAWEIWKDRGAHVSIAPITEMQMRLGMPPLQQALDHGILPSLSPDVETNMTSDPFSLMRGAYCLQRGLANDLAFPISNPGELPVPQVITSRQVIEMATVAGAAANRVLDKVGTLTVGKEADIVVLDTRNVNLWPMNNAPGTIVTMMNPRHVRDVLIAGKVVYWKGKLVGWDVDALCRRIEQSRDRVLARINGPAKIGAIPQGNNSGGGPYRPNFLGNCCHKGQNTKAPDYVLRP
jgi:5-methylthioadenosine/S-adenosylhomocysteine deaminase